MYKINVKVESNKVDIISQTVPITTNSLNTIKCLFDLPTEYEGLNCVAIFTCIDKEYREIIVDKECMIPKEVLSYSGRVKLGVYAFRGEALLYSPAPTGFRVEMGSCIEENGETENTQNGFNKIVERANEVYLKIKKADTDLDTKVAEINQKLENGDFNGKDGVNGQNGTDGKSAYQIAAELGFKGTEQEWLDSLKAEENTKIHYKRGTIDFSSLETLQFFQKIADDYNNKKNIYFIWNKKNETILYGTSMTTENPTKIVLYAPKTLKNFENVNYLKRLVVTAPSIIIKLNDSNKVTEVTYNEPTNADMYVLPKQISNQEYNGYFEPMYQNDPVSKGYLEKTCDEIQRRDLNYISSFEGNTEILKESTDNKLIDINILGVTEQESDPSFENPCDISCMGGNTVQIEIKNNKNENKSQIYSLRMENIKLYEGEEIYEENGKLYYDKKWEEAVLNGSDIDGVWKQENATGGYRYYCKNENRQILEGNNVVNILSNKLAKKTGLQTWNGEEGISGSGCYIQIRMKEFNENKTLDEFKQFLSENPVSIIYELAVPIKIEITNENFIEDYNALKQAKTYYNETEIQVKGLGKVKGTYISLDNTKRVNLYDKEKVVDGEYYNLNGDIDKATTVARTDLIDVSKFNKIYVNNNGLTHYYTFFDENKKFLNGLKNSNNEYSFCIPSRAKYFSSALYKDEKETLIIEAQYDNKNSLTLDYVGKIMNCLGDSITYGFIPDNGEQMDKPYPTILQEKLGLSDCRNYGISSSTLSDNYESMSIRYANMNNNADIISVFGGTNDYGRNATLGELGDTENKTVYGALDVLCNGLINKYPKAFIFFMTPLRRADKVGVNASGFTLEDIAKAIKEVCYKYSIPVLDLYEKGGFHIEKEIFRNIYGGNDRIHPNQDFVEQHLAPMIEKFIRANY